MYYRPWLYFSPRSMDQERFQPHFEVRSQTHLCVISRINIKIVPKKLLMED